MRGRLKRPPPGAQHDPSWASASSSGRPIRRTLGDRAGHAGCRDSIKGLPEGFRFHDLRHYFASLLIADGLDVEVFQARLRHASAKTTLDVYGHMWPDKDEA